MKTLNFKLALIVVIIFSSNLLYSNKFFEKITPEYLHNQMGGNQGFYSFGFGYQKGCRNFYEVDFSYGITPDNVGGKLVQQFNIRNRIYFFKKSYKNISFRQYSGIHVIMNTNENATTWFKLPEKYPSRYYFPTAIHGILAFGSKIQFETENKYLKNLAFYSEISSLDSYLRAFFMSEFEVPFDEIWTWSLGIGYFF